MNLPVVALLVLVALLVVAGKLGLIDLRTAGRKARRWIGTGAVAAGAFCAATGRIALGAALVIGGLALLGSEPGALGPVWKAVRLSPLGALAGLFGARPRGRRSTMRSAALEVEVDHDSGVISGRVLVGRFEGRDLARLSVADLLALRREVGNDAESRALLEAYLDRRSPAWREDLQDDPAARSRGAARPGAMTEEEAYQILGLQPGAGDAEVRDAHRRLMKAVHPDMGGSTFLAAKINEAKDRLVGRHGTRSKN